MKGLKDPYRLKLVYKSKQLVKQSQVLIALLFRFHTLIDSTRVQPNLGNSCNILILFFRFSAVLSTVVLMYLHVFHLWDENGIYQWYYRLCSTSLTVGLSLSLTALLSSVIFFLS